MADRPNILFIMTDQHRGDAIGADPDCPTDDDGAPVVHTPNLNQLVGDGTLFRRAYTPAPSSIPARRCLWTGQTPATNGCPNWTTADWDFEHTLPGVLTQAGYQTRLTGKTHALPERNHFGFEHIVLHAGLSGTTDDYDEWIETRTGGEADEISHGIGRNSWDARPWHRDEEEHPTTWTTNRAIEFFEKRDPTRPFFHTVSYVRPHQPYDPPTAYWELYGEQDLPEPPVGDWASDVYGAYQSAYPKTTAWTADLPRQVEERARRGYYGSITHIDHQINRLVRELSNQGELENTIICFAADHGDMLGDHNLWRKTYAYEGSARVPLILRLPDSLHDTQPRIVDKPVGLEDLMPTFLSLADVSVPDTVEGLDLTRIVDDDQAEWRQYYHGEHGPVYHDENATQYLVGTQLKYVWNPVTGTELLFDLDDDPRELENLATDDDERLARWRSRLVDELSDRPEGFTDGDTLQKTVPERPVV